jgi:HPt (histidine-containing phosphotransfer) domain-containing protein
MDINEISKLPLIDNDQVAMLAEAGEDTAAELMEELLALFQEEAAPHLVSLKENYAQENFVGMARLAHAVAGSSANLGGLRLSKLAKAVEVAANNKDTAKINSLIGDLDAMYEETVEGFHAEIARIRFSG